MSAWEIIYNENVRMYHEGGKLPWFQRRFSRSHVRSGISHHRMFDSSEPIALGSLCSKSGCLHFEFLLILLDIRHSICDYLL